MAENLVIVQVPLKPYPSSERGPSKDEILTNTDM